LQRVTNAFSDFDEKHGTIKIKKKKKKNLLFTCE